MTFSKIEITFDSDFLLNYRLYFSSSLIDNTFDWKTTRSGSFQVTVGTPTSNIGERTAINFVTAFNLDTNNTSQYVVTRNINVVTIKSNNPLETFNDLVAVQRFFLQHGAWDEEVIEIPFTITNYTGGIFTIDSTNFSTYSSDPENYVNISVTTNILAPNFISPISYVGNMDNPFVFAWMRNQNILIECNNGSGQSATLSIQTPSFFDISNKQVIINSSPFGANITINLNAAPDLTIEYSLDNSTWQNSNSFSGITSGNYTVYVRDQYGCNKSFAMVVGANNINVPYFYISKANSFRFVNRINFGTSANYKNDENTLSCEAFAKDKRLAYKEIQLFNSSDVITTQFKSNYGAHLIKVLTEEAPIPTDASSNMLLYSEDLNNSVWTKALVNITGNKVNATSIYGYHNIIQNVNKGSSAGNYTFSFYIKKAEYSIVNLSINNDTGAKQVFCGFNSNNQTFFGGFGFGGFNFISSNFTDKGNGYFRVSMKVTLDTTTDVKLKIELKNASGNSDYTGTDSEGLYLDKFQFQEGDLTPYLQTTSTPLSTTYSDGYHYPQVLKKTNNIGLKESLDAKIFAYTTTKSGVYFTSGNTYDFTSGSTNGTHSLYGSVPIWATAGNYIKIGTNFYLIEDVIYDDNKNSDIIIFSNPYVGTADANVIVGSIYNLKNYEVYEFTIDLVTYLNSKINIQLQATDSNFQTITLLSEDIDIAVAQEDTIDIHYWNENNTDIYYATGLKNRIRIPITQMVAYDPMESEIHKTDTDAILLDSEMYEGIEITFEPQTKELHRKTKQALLHKFVYIDDVKYVLDGNFDVEQLQDSNLYVLKCKMLKAGNVFSNNNATGYEFDNTNQQIPGLISTQSGFVKY